MDDALRRPGSLEHDPEKWDPVFGKDHAPMNRHDPEKVGPGFSEKIMRQ
jgi:hypothetical protein